MNKLYGTLKYRVICIFTLSWYFKHFCTNMCHTKFGENRTQGIRRTWKILCFFLLIGTFSILLNIYVQMVLISEQGLKHYIHFKTLLLITHDFLYFKNNFLKKLFKSLVKNTWKDQYFLYKKYKISVTLLPDLNAAGNVLMLFFEKI